MLGRRPGAARPPGRRRGGCSGASTPSPPCTSSTRSTPVRGLTGCLHCHSASPRRPRPCAGGEVVRAGRRHAGVPGGGGPVAAQRAAVRVHAGVPGRGHLQGLLPRVHLQGHRPLQARRRARRLPQSPRLHRLSRPDRPPQAGSRPRGPARRRGQRRRHRLHRCRGPGSQLPPMLRDCCAMCRHGAWDRVWTRTACPEALLWEMPYVACFMPGLLSGNPFWCEHWLLPRPESATMALCCRAVRCSSAWTP